MNPWVVRLMRPFVRRGLRRQKIQAIEVRGASGIQSVLDQDAGIVITPNHSFHYDSYVLIETSHRLKRPFHFLTAWQVFEMSTPFEQWMLQRHGCYSINREANDLKAFKTSVDILQRGRHPLVVFPEGDIYHHNDRISPFRDGAAAIALSAAKRSSRPIVAVPCATKAFYMTDPTPELSALMTRLEESLHWKPLLHKGLSERIYRVAEGLLALKELEYLEQAQSGPIIRRVRHLANEVLGRLERKYQIPTASDAIPERVKDVRRAIIAEMEKGSANEAERRSREDDLEDMFFVIQLYSYPGHYVAENPVIERLAETIDKFEEDVLHAVYPAIRGTRMAVVQFGDPITIPGEKQSKSSISDWTDRLEKRVQELLDDINSHPPKESLSAASKPSIVS